MNKQSSFMELPLSNGMKQTIKTIGYLEPTPIQQRAIPELLLGKDLLGQAQTGTGKTAAFAIPLIELVDESNQNIQALVVCPTRELCLQVCQEITRLSEHKVGLASLAVYGGQSIEQQFRSLKIAPPQIVVATPGRLFDHLRRKSIALSTVRMIVLDEADEMLDMGFRSEIEEIFDLLPEENQRIFFSATMPKAINDLACTYLREPKIVKTESKSLTVNTIEQSYIKVRGREKTSLLCRLLDYRNPKLAVVFCNAKSIADELVDEISARGFEAGVLHGDLSQNQRDRVMAKFKSGAVRVLVATDVAARGLDIDDVEMVLNFHLPHDPEDYVHRIGRTGRAGRKGWAISLVEARDNSRLRRISQFARVEIAEAHTPTLADVKKAKIKNLFNQVREVISGEKISEYKSVVAEANVAPEDIAAAMIQMALKRVDESHNDDALFAELSSKKYSGMGAERRFRDKSERFGGRSFGGRPRVSRNDRNEERPKREYRPNRERGERFQKESFAAKKPGRNFETTRNGKPSEAPRNSRFPSERSNRRDEQPSFNKARDERREAPGQRPHDASKPKFMKKNPPRRGAY